MERDSHGAASGLGAHATGQSLGQRLARKFTGNSEWFRDRELFLRGDGSLKYLRLTRRRQLVLVGVGAVAAVWVVAMIAATGYLSLDRVAAEREAEAQKQAYLSLLSDIGGYHREFARIVGEFEGNQSLLLSRLSEAEEGDDEAPADLGADIETQLNDTRIDAARMLVVRQALRSHMETFEADLKQLAARDADQRARLQATLDTLEQTRAEGSQVAEASEVLDEELNRLESDVDRLTRENGALAAMLTNTQAQLDTSRANNEALVRQSKAYKAEVQSLYSEVGAAPLLENRLNSEVAALRDELDTAASRVEALQAQRDFHEARADKMESRLDEVSDIQEAVVARLAKRTTAGIDMIERIVAMTGLNVNDLVDAADVESLGLAQGGPYFDVAGDYLIEDDPHLEFQSSVVVLNQQMDRWEALQEVIRTIPLASPLDHYRVSSGYGERVDPVNGRKAMHYGIDLKAPLKTPIMATAPGTVVFAGWRGQYGRVVELDHGNGIRTRYAHLRKLLVKKGEEVAHRQEIGLLGNSGRSTGAHVHYEVQVDGKPRDPALFVMAGRNAFKD